MKDKILTTNQNNFIFYFSIFLALVLVLFTTPFLHYPYDIYAHLISIDEIYNNENKITTSIQSKRLSWHHSWAKLFYYMDLDSTQMFLRAKIIHILQTYVALFSIYYFSKVVIRNIFKNISKITLKWLSVWSIIIWITIFATFSGYYHQTWIMWYSVNYQITLPLFWYIAALTLVLLLEKTSWKVKLFFVLQIVLLSRLMLQIHSMEFLYYLMHIGIFYFVFIDKTYLVLKKYFYIIIPILLSAIYMSKYYLSDTSKILNYLSFEKLPSLYERIMQQGLFLLNGHNRALASVNELMYFILFLGIIFILFLLWNQYKDNEDTIIRFRILLYLLITSMFILIPLFQHTGGLFSVITRMNVVNRFYYSSSLFVLIPVFTYYIFQKYRLRYINLFILSSLVLVTVFSKHSDRLHHNYYKNIQSIKNSFSEKKVGFNLSSKQIKDIEDILKMYEKKNTTGLPIYYYARADIAFVIKYIYKKNVYWKSRRINPDYVKIYKDNKNNKSYYPVWFKIPEGFPPYNPYM